MILPRSLTSKGMMMKGGLSLALWLDCLKLDRCSACPGLLDPYDREGNGQQVSIDTKIGPLIIIAAFLFLVLKFEQDSSSALNASRVLTPRPWSLIETGRQGRGGLNGFGPFLRFRMEPASHSFHRTFTLLIWSRLLPPPPLPLPSFAACIRLCFLASFPSTLSSLPPDILKTDNRRISAFAQYIYGALHPSISTHLNNCFFPS
jgi:hypothetical protein